MDKPDELPWDDIIEAVDQFLSANGYCGCGQPVDSQHDWSLSKLCESCGTLVAQPCGVCPHCHGYRFTENP